MPLDVSLFSPEGSSVDSVGYNLSLSSWETANNNYHSTSWSPYRQWSCNSAQKTRVLWSRSMSCLLLCSLISLFLLFTLPPDILTDFLAVWEFSLAGIYKGWRMGTQSSAPAPLSLLSVSLVSAVLKPTSFLLPCVSPAVPAVLCCSLHCPSEDMTTHWDSGCDGCVTACFDWR